MCTFYAANGEGLNKIIYSRRFSFINIFLCAIKQIMQDRTEKNMNDE